MSWILGNWLYFVAIVLAMASIGASVFAALRFPKYREHLNSVIAALALLFAGLAFAHTVKEASRQRRENRPDITGWVSAIEFSASGKGKGLPSAPPGMRKLTFDLVVQNSGAQETMLVACWFVLEGASRDKAESLFLTPPNLTIPA